MSAGAFYRPSVRRALRLPPAWQGRRVRPVPAVFPLPGHRSLAEVADWPAAPLPEGIERETVSEIAGAEGTPADSGGGREARAPEGTSGAAPAGVRSKDPANARERHKPAVRPVKVIDLAEVRSAMDERAEAARAADVSRARARVEQLAKTALVPCRCGSRQGGNGRRLVPAWFGRDCIEPGCPLKPLKRSK